MSMTTSQQLKKELLALGTKKRADLCAYFFKTGPGQYGAGDIFIGVTMPQLRKTLRQFRDLSFTEIQKLLDDKFHECRMAGLLILVSQFERSDDKQERKKIYNFYLKNYKAVNNWDLVDLSAPKIVGGYMFDQPRDLLYTWARSNHLWKKRIAIVATLQLIRFEELSDTFKVCEILMSDNHDLIHKACGWMLREAGKKNEVKLKNFLDEHSGQMPRTMLRYSIERMSDRDRKHYMTKK